MVGLTDSADFPTLDACFPNYFGNTDAFVSNFSSTGVLLQSTFLGGDAYDDAFGVAVDSQNRVVVGGATRSIDFPISLNTHQGYVDDAYVVLLVCSDAATTTIVVWWICWPIIIPIIFVTLVIGNALGFAIGKRRS